jgi:integrase/recombinase XerC
MQNALAVVERVEIQVVGQEVLKDFMNSLSIATRRVYDVAFRSFAEFLGIPADETGSWMIESGPGAVNQKILAYKTSLRSAGVSSSAINQRLSAFRSFSKIARTLGAITWTIEIGNVKKESVKDSRGPGLSGFKRLLVEAGQEQSPKRERDLAILSLAFALALRRAEISSLDLSDLNLETRSLSVLRKGKHQKAMMLLPQETMDTLKAWLDLRGSESGPLFYSLGVCGRVRFTGDGIYNLITTLGKRAGVSVKPHGIRHVAITAAQEAGCTLYETQVFAGHADPRTTQTYFDVSKPDIAGKVSETVVLNFGRWHKKP